MPWYEDIFCLGEHALGETAQCISNESASAAQIRQAEAPPPGAMMAPTSAAAASMPISANIPVASASLSAGR